MPTVYDELDLAWSPNGDIALGTNGDLLDTSTDTIRSLREQVGIICASSINDWVVYPSKGATLSDFIGEPNTPDTADAISDRLRLALTSAGVVNEEDLSIRVIPIQLHKVMIVVRIEAVETTTNSLDSSGILTVALVYDSQQNGLFIIKNNLGE